MVKINGCLKCLFIFFNTLFAIIGCVLVFGLVKFTAYSYKLSALGTPGLGWVWVFAIGILAISCLGIYAGASEKELIIKIFAGFMAVGMIIMLIFGIIVVVERNKVKHQFDTLSSEAARTILQDDGLKEMLEAIQQQVQCCGVVSAKDWGDDIPSSCACQSGYVALGSGCKAKPQGSRGPNQIFQQTCSDFIFGWIDVVFNAAMGFFFGFAVTALLGLLVSILMVHQIRRYDNMGSSSIAMKGY